jgi:hypothetical protein
MIEPRSRSTYVEVKVDGRKLVSFASLIIDIVSTVRLRVQNRGNTTMQEGCAVAVDDLASDADLRKGAWRGVPRTLVRIVLRQVS